ncbi:MAG: hypothetical protein ACTSUE_26500 [Promethearchaeota archaeon]
MTERLKSAKFWLLFFSGSLLILPLFYGVIEITGNHVDNYCIETSQIGAPPVSNTPPDQSVLVNQAGVVIPWIITDPDNSSGLYAMQRNGVTITSTINPPSWTNGVAINFPVDTSTPGYYNYSIGFIDGIVSQNAGADTVWIRVEEPPIIQTVDTQKVHTGAVNQFFEIIIADSDSNGTLNLTINGTSALGPNYNWNASQAINFPINTTTAGLYNYSVIATDSNYTIQKDTIVWINDHFPPDVNVEPYSSVVSPDIGTMVLNCTIIDYENVTGNFTFYQENSPFNSSVDNATWANNSIYIFQIDVSTVGTSNYSIIAEDLDGNQTRVNFNITTNSPPTITTPVNTSYARTTLTTYNITWTISDLDNVTGTWTVYRDNIDYYPPYSNQPWTSGSDITITVYANVIHVYNYTIVFDDGVSTRQQTVIITITPAQQKLSENTILLLLGGTIIFGLVGMGVILKNKDKN